MKNTIKATAIVMMTALSLISCRKENDTLHNFSTADLLTWNKATDSFGEKFKALWEGLNSNYAIWDYEKEHGLDWDAVYDEFYPKFVELDTLALDEQINDETLTKLLKQVVDPLHDGHMAVSMKNHSSGGTVVVCPSDDRNNKEREKELATLKNWSPSLAYYIESGKVKDIKMVDVSARTQIHSVLDSLSKWSNRTLETLSGRTVVTEDELDRQIAASRILADVSSIKKLSETEAIVNALNSTVLKYDYLQIPGVHMIDAKLINDDIIITSALLEGNIAYLYFNNFSLTPYLTSFPKDEYLQPYAKELSKDVLDAWYLWFNAIQDLHKSNQLGGVIIDVRGNGGGKMSDFQFVIGALVPSGGLHIMNTRFKRGVGRYDYSPIMPYICATLGIGHVTVTEPIVVLANAKSVSMSEITTISTKVIDNAKFIGTTTWGGLCGLLSNEAYSYTYAGHIGVEGVTPVYVYCPSVATLDINGNVLEGKGVTPDIEIALEKSSNGADNQLDRAIEYIISGK
ncbi:MAG: hypothetical protein J6O51_07365 [Bacteroidales bacterium]|nr:hypothetical protein [Bacteroidales bacterium]